MIIFLSLGSNIGDRLKNLKTAIELIKIEQGIEVITQSKVYETSPMEYKEQDFFLNQVIEIDSNIDALSLLELFKRIEFQIGRKKTKYKNMPRIIDIDILSYGDFIINNHNLFIPHPKIKFRKFILKPWTDIAPNYILPSSKNTIKDLLGEISHLTDKVREYS
tara:strand:- start:42 stop:530 length:489 start_codon:yes stop_codon:yes gene_type:complete